MDDCMIEHFRFEMINIIEILGVISFSLSGIMEARRKEMDFIGNYTVAFVTAFGGGTLRDILLNRHPLFWIENQIYTLGVLVLTIIAAIFYHFKKFTISEQAILIPDALGLGLFSATGTAYAFELGFSPFVCMLMGIITATFGGVLRDIICNEVPVIFKRSQLYATCSFFAASVYLCGRLLHYDTPFVLLASIVMAVGLRLLAIKYDLKLPI